jgi:hypothetical protein
MCLLVVDFIRLPCLRQALIVPSRRVGVYSFLTIGAEIRLGYQNKNPTRSNLGHLHSLQYNTFMISRLTATDVYMKKDFDAASDNRNGKQPQFFGSRTFNASEVQAKLGK